MSAEAPAGGPSWERLAGQLRSLRYPLAVSLCVTLISFAFGICGALSFEKEVPGGSWLSFWQRWDAPWFLDIAQHGYAYASAQHREHLIALLPVYPAAIWLTHLLIPNWQAAAVVLSNVCFAAALAYLFLLARMEYNVRAARDAVLLCAIFPTAYFFHAGYSEGIFLLLSVAAFYYARSGQWFLCGIFGMLATGTRLPGAAIAPALALEYFQQRDFRWRAIRWDAVFLLLVPLGTLAYLWINFHYFGDPLHFLTAQKKFWGSFLRWPVPAVRDNWYGIHHAPGDQRILQYGGPFVAFIVLTSAFVTAPFALRPCYSLYLALSWVIIFCNSFPISAPRYVLVVFPIFLLLARVTRRRWVRDSLAFLCAVFYAICGMHFVRGWWAF